MRLTRTIAPLVGVALAASSGCAASQPASAGPTTITVVTHDSFYLPEDLVSSFEAESGIELEFVAPGDAGALVNQLILTAGAPLGDVVYGVDNTFGSRAVEAGVFAPYTASGPGATGAARFAFPGSDALTAVDFSDVCLNVDVGYFADAGIPAPATLEDLLKPDYAGLVSVTNPATSSPGLAFLLETVAAFGEDGWQDYWRALAGNGLRVTASWSDTYFVDFSAPNYGGDYPVVLSYASSPPSEVIDGEPTTAALLDTCFRQVEYAGVLAGTANPDAAGQVVDWLLSDEVQSALPEAMYVYPVSETVTVPSEWEAYAPLAAQPWSLDPTAIDQGRDGWIREWREIVTG